MPATEGAARVFAESMRDVLLQLFNRVEQTAPQGSHSEHLG